MKHISVGGTGRAPALGIKGHVGCLGEQWWKQKPRGEDSKVMMAGSVPVILGTSNSGEVTWEMLASLSIKAKILACPVKLLKNFST